MMAKHYNYNNRVLISILVLYIFSLFLHLDRIPLKFEEPRRALVALEMMHNDNYIVPTLNGTNYYNKPPVFNWLLIGLFEITGSTEEWVVRLPTVLSFLAIGVLLFLFVRQYLKQEVALFAALFWLTSADIYFHFSIVGEIDVFFTLLVMLQVMSIFHFYKKGAYAPMYLISYLFMAIGVLTKGLPSIAFQGLTLVAMTIAFRQWKWLFHPLHFASGLLALGIMGGYFYMYNQYEDVAPFLVRLFFESSSRTPIATGWLATLRHALLFPLLHIKLFLPWLLFAGVMVNKSRWSTFFHNDLLKFAFYFSLLNILPYWISPGTRDRYLYPFIPFVMIGVSWTFVHYYTRSRVGKWVDGVMLAFICLFTLLPLSFNHFEELDQIKWLWLKSLAFVVAFALLIVAYFRYKSSRIWVFLTTFIVARLVFDLIIIPSREHTAMEQKKYKTTAIDVAARTEGEKVYWLGDKESIERKVSLPGLFEDTVIVNEPEWADFAIAFYFTKHQNSILVFTDHYVEGAWHLVSSARLIKLDREFDTEEKYYLPEKDQYYYLVR